MSTFDTALESDVRLIGALLAGATYEDAAQMASCSKSTVVRRMADPAFRTHLDQLRRAVIMRAADLLATETLRSVSVLAELRDDPALPGNTRARAARDLLDLAARYHDAADLGARIAAIEHQLDLRRSS